MGQTPRFQEILRSLAIVDESFPETKPGSGFGSPGSRLLGRGCSDRDPGKVRPNGLTERKTNV